MSILMITLAAPGLWPLHGQTVRSVPAPPQNAQQATEPVENFSCKIVSDSGQKFDLKWRIAGRRGFAIEGYRGHKLYPSTPMTVEITSDSSGRFTELEFKLGLRLNVGGLAFTGKRRNYAAFQYSMEHASRFGRTAVTIFANSPDNNFEIYSGVCAVTAVQQQPMPEDYKGPE